MPLLVHIFMSLQLVIKMCSHSHFINQLVWPSYRSPEHYTVGDIIMKHIAGHVHYGCAFKKDGIVSFLTGRARQLVILSSFERDLMAPSHTHRSCCPSFCITSKNKLSVQEFIFSIMLAKFESIVDRHIYVKLVKQIRILSDFEHDINL